MLSRLVLDDELIDIQTEFLLNEDQRIATFYSKNYKSCLLCEVLGHDYFSCEGFKDSKLTEIITFCIRCKIQTIEKFKMTKKIIELVN